MRIWNARNGHLIRELPHNESVADARFSDDGRSIATGCYGWDGEDLARGRRGPVLFYGHVGPVNSVAFDASGERLVSAGADRTVRVWDSAGGEPLVTLLNHAKARPERGFGAGAKEVISSQETSRSRRRDVRCADRSQRC